MGTNGLNGVSNGTYDLWQASPEATQVMTTA